MREAVLDTRVDDHGRAVVLFRGAPLQGCTGLEIGSAVTAIASWAAANNGIVRMRTTLPDGSTTEDFIHGDGRVVPVAPQAGRRAAPSPAVAPLQHDPVTSVPAAAISHYQPSPPPEMPARPQPATTTDPAAAFDPRRAVGEFSPAPVDPTFPADPFARMNHADADPPRAPHRLAEAVRSAVGADAPAPRTQASWKAPLDDDVEAFDVESPIITAAEHPGRMRKYLIRAAVLLVLVAVAALLGFMFTTPGPGAQATVMELPMERASVSEPSGAGAGASLPENPMLSLALAGGLIVAAGGIGGLALLKIRRRPGSVADTDIDGLGLEEGFPEDPALPDTTDEPAAATQ